MPRRILALTLWILLASPTFLPNDPSSAASAASTQETSEPRQPPFAVQVEKTLALLDAQIARQHELLQAAQTDRERQLIDEHLRFLEEEHRSIEELLEQLIGSRVEAREAAQEQQAEYRAEQSEKILEKKERLTRP